MAKADAEDGQLLPKMRNDVTGQASFGRTARTGTDDDPFGSQFFNLFQGRLIIPFHPDVGVRTDLPDSLNEVERERVIVVEQKNHPEPLFSVAIGDAAQAKIKPDKGHRIGASDCLHCWTQENPDRLISAERTSSVGTIKLSAATVNLLDLQMPDVFPSLRQILQKAGPAGAVASRGTERQYIPVA